MANVRSWVLRDYMSEQGLHPTDLLVEFSTVTFAAATYELPTKFVTGNVVAIFIGKITSSAIYYMSTDKTVTTGCLTITASGSSTEAVDVMVVGRVST